MGGLALLAVGRPVTAWAGVRGLSAVLCAVLLIGGASAEAAAVPGAVQRADEVSRGEPCVARSLEGERGIRCGWLSLVAEAVSAQASPSFVFLAPEIPLIEQYWFSATLEAGAEKVLLDGYVPDAGAKARLASLRWVNVDSLELGRGAPQRFESVVEFGLDMVKALSEGRFSLRGNLVTVRGTAKSAQDYERLSDLIAEGLPQGGVLALAEVVPPRTERFEWTATKGSDGAVSLAGLVPSREVRATLGSAVGRLGGDALIYASGAPGDFESLALRALGVLEAMDEGVVGYDGQTWRISGEAGSIAEAEAVRAAFSAAGLGGPDLSLRIAEPQPIVVAATPSVAPPGPVEETPDATLAGPPAENPPPETPPAQEPAAESPPDEAEVAPAIAAEAEPAAPQPMPSRDYAFGASKQAGGSLVLTGAIPAESYRTMFGSLAGGSMTSGLVVDPGAPDGFLDSASAGLRALSALSSGTLSFEEGTWTLRGVAPDETARTAAIGEIVGLPEGSAWITEVTAPNPLDRCRAEVEQFSGSNSILFQSGSDRIADASLPGLDALARVLVGCAEAKVEVEGHTDADGSDELNLALSVARAEAVVRALIERGVQASRLYAIGYGESLPVAPNETAEGKRLNRRIIFRIPG